MMPRARLFQFPGLLPQGSRPPLYLTRDTANGRHEGDQP